MSWNGIKKKISIGTIWLWIIFSITTIVMIALVVGNVFPPNDFWIPIIPIGILLVLSVIATLVDFRAERRIKIGIIASWTVFLLAVVLFTALILGRVFTPNEYWIPIIPIGALFVLSAIPTILEYTTGEVKFCPKCGRLFEKKWDFCQECGTRILMKCPSCGLKVKGNPKYCTKCGINLSEIEVIQTSSPHLKFKAEGYTNLCKQCGAPAKPEAKYCVFCGVSQ
ncbi:MAG: zinc ribbon domain-containing protein [Candidatus Lokiarchaeota archaeon]|nr:zinc ribbon domain-containing protein [Candidatus Lokiarchaeota archaeon]